MERTFEIWFDNALYTNKFNPEMISILVLLLKSLFRSHISFLDISCFGDFYLDIKVDETTILSSLAPLLDPL